VPNIQSINLKTPLPGFLSKLLPSAGVLALLVLLAFCSVSFANGSQGILFFPNKGQWQRNVIYKTYLDGGNGFIEKDGITINFYDKTTLRAAHISKPDVPVKINSHAIKIKWLNCLNGIEFKEEKRGSYYHNYFLGKDQDKWAGGVYGYQMLTCKEVWKGIDVVVEGQSNAMKFTYIVDSQANPDDIRLQYAGTDDLYVKKGKLYIKTSINELTEQDLFVFQEINGTKKQIKAAFELSGNNVVGFKILEKYDKNLPLIIDPVLIFASYSGSTADNFGFTATYDNQGNLYAGGIAFNNGYPTTIGAFDIDYSGLVQFGRTDVVISKFDSSGTFLQYSTYLGGADGTEAVSSLVVNNQGELFVLGVTGSNDFPVTAGAFDQTFNGGTPGNYSSIGTNYLSGTDLFVTHFNSTGTALIGSTYVGGSLNEGVNDSPLNFNYGDLYRGEITLDIHGNCYVGSCTYSADFPVLPSALQPNHSGGLDGVFFKFNPALTAMLAGSFLGGSGDDGIYSLTVDDSLSVYVTGGTNSFDLPVSPGTIQPAYQGGLADGYVFHIDSTFQQIIAGTYIGTNQYDQSFFVQVDADRDVYLYGQSLGSMPISPGVYNNPNSCQFIMKLDNLLSNTIFSTVFGNGDGTINISPTAFLVDICENIYISGWGGDIISLQPTFNMPLTSDAVQPNTDGYNFYLAVFENNLSQLLYGTYFGGNVSREHVDGGTSRFDKRGIVYQCVCAGCGSNDDFPTTPGAWSNTNNSSNCNIGVFKFDFQIRLAVADFSADVIQGCAPLTVQFNNNSSNTSTFNWDFAGLQTSTDPNPVFTFSQPGTYLVKLIASDPLSCNGTDSTLRLITVFPVPDAGFTYNSQPCSNVVTFNDQSITNGSPITSWNWQFGDGNNSSNASPVHTYLNQGTYDVQLVVSNQAGCADTISQQLVFNSITAQGSFTLNCQSNTVSFTNQTNGANAVVWAFNDPAQPNATSTANNPQFNYAGPGIYSPQLIIFYGAQNECSDTLNLSINIPPPLQALIGIQQDSCGNNFNLSDLTSSTGNQVVQRQWLLGDGTTSSDSAFSHQYQPGSYLLTLIVTDINGCQDTARFTVNVRNYGPIIAPNDKLLCLPEPIQLIASGGDFYSWTPPAFFNNPSIANPIATVNEPTTLGLTIIRIGINGDTCKFQNSFTIDFLQTGAQIIATANPDTILAGASSQLNFTGYTGSSFNWSPNYNISGVTLPSPTVTPDTSTTYTISINVSDECVLTARTRVVVLNTICANNEVFIPNTFTPNGDGLNDKFFIRGNGVQKIELSIYNRWGELVYESDDIKAGWDGVYKGKPADPGVFAYYVKIYCIAGEELIRKGNVTLIR
jgi:gliding motility-associated-like protein